LGKRYLYNIIHKLSDVGQQQRKETYMNFFTCIAIKPLNDGTKGFRFNLLGLKGLTRKRQFKSRGFKLFDRSDCMVGFHFWKRTVWFETKRNTNSVRKLWHFAG